MKKMITLGLIGCMSFSNTTFGMLTNKLTKRIQAQHRRYYSLSEESVIQITAKIRHLEEQLAKQTEATKATNKKLDMLSQHLTAQAQEAKKTPLQPAPQEEQQGLKEWQPVVYEPKELYSTPQQNAEASPTRYQRELEAYHARSSIQE